MAANPESNAIWGVLEKKHPSGKGWSIGKYDAKQGLWHADETQPEGSRWYALTVDSNGIPAVISDSVQ